MEENFRKTLFWETDLKFLDYKKDADFIISRVLDFGNLKEWKLVKEIYGLKRIKKIAKKHIFFDPKSANFYSLILKISCTKKPFLEIPKMFSKH